MLKPIIALVAFALAGTAGAANWRDLRIDASSEEAFAQSLEAFKDKLSPARGYVFGKALQDIWIAGTKAANAEQRDYTADDYYRQLHGLTYDEVVTLTDPSGDTAKERYRSASLNPNLGAPVELPQGDGQFWRSPNSAYVPHGGTDLTGPGPGQQ